MKTGEKSWLNYCLGLPWVLPLFLASLLAFASNAYAKPDSSCEEKTNTNATYEWVDPKDIDIFLGTRKQWKCEVTNTKDGSKSTYNYGYESPNCHSGAVVNSSGTGCTCAPPSKYNGASKSCKCPEGQVLENGQCKEPDDCSDRLFGDLSGSSTDGSCDCPSGTTEFTGVCKNNCPSGQHFDSNGNCENNCNNGYEWDGSACSCSGSEGTVNGVQTCVPSSGGGNENGGGNSGNEGGSGDGSGSNGEGGDSGSGDTGNGEGSGGDGEGGGSSGGSGSGSGGNNGGSDGGNSGGSEGGSGTGGGISLGSDGYYYQNGTHNGNDECVTDCYDCPSGYEWSSSAEKCKSKCSQGYDYQLSTNSCVVGDTGGGTGTDVDLSKIEGLLTEINDKLPEEQSLDNGEKGSFNTDDVEEKVNTLKTNIRAKLSQIRAEIGETFSAPTLSGAGSLPCHRNIPTGINGQTFDICLADYNEEFSLIPLFISGMAFVLAAFIILGGSRGRSD